jgi:hypothetical protein
VRTTEPGPFSAAQVGGHRRLLIEHLLRPVAGFGVASLGRKHARKIQVRLRRRRLRGYLPEECLGFFSLSRLRVGVGKQSCRAMEIIVGFFRDDSLQVGQRARSIAKQEGANTASVKGVERIGAGSNGFVERGSCQLEPAVVHIKVAEFFVIPRRRIISNDRFKFANALATRKNLEGLTKQSNIRNSLDENVYERTERTEKEDDENPVDVRSSPDEVDDRKPLEQQAPREEKMAQKSYAVVIQRQLNILLSSSREGLTEDLRRDHHSGRCET